MRDNGQYCNDHMLQIITWGMWITDGEMGLGRGTGDGGNYKDERTCTKQNEKDISNLLSLPKTITAKTLKIKTITKQTTTNYRWCTDFFSPGIWPIYICVCTNISVLVGFISMTILKNEVVDMIKQTSVY